MGKQLEIPGLPPVEPATPSAALVAAARDAIAAHRDERHAWQKNAGGFDWFACHAYVDGRIEALGRHAERDRSDVGAASRAVVAAHEAAYKHDLDDANEIECRMDAFDRAVAALAALLPAEVIDLAAAREARRHG